MPIVCMMMWREHAVEENRKSDVNAKTWRTAQNLLVAVPNGCTVLRSNGGVVHTCTEQRTWTPVAMTMQVPAYYGADVPLRHLVADDGRAEPDLEECEVDKSQRRRPSSSKSPNRVPTGCLATDQNPIPGPYGVSDTTKIPFPGPYGVVDGKSPSRVPTGLRMEKSHRVLVRMSSICFIQFFAWHLKMS